MRIKQVKKSIAKLKPSLDERKLNGTWTVNLERRLFLMERGIRKVRIGRVVCDKMDKTIVVAVED